MRDLGRIQRSMSRATRGLIWTDAGLSLAFVFVLALGPIIMRERAVTGGEGAGKKVETQSPAQVTAAEVEKMTTGKVLFRTSATSLKEKVVDELAQFQLKGISMRGGQKLAHVRDTKLKKLMTKKVGESLGPYEIVDITNDGLTLRRGTVDVILSKG